MGEEVLTFPRNKGSDGTHGIQFEWETTLLTYLKCVVEHEEWKETKHSGLKSFFVANNLNGVGAFDDVVVRKEIVEGGAKTTKLILTQCKHVAVKEARERKGGNYVNKKEIQKYFDSFIKVYKVFHENNISLSNLGAKEKKNEDLRSEIQIRLELKRLFNCQFSECEFSFVSNIVSFPTDLFENVTKRAVNYEFASESLSGRHEELEYKLRAEKCQEFLVCEEFSENRNVLIIKFCNMFRIFSIPDQKTHLDNNIKDVLKKLYKENISIYEMEKKDLQDTLLGETKLAFEVSTLLNDKSNMFQKIYEYIYVKKMSKNKISNYKKIIPLNIKASNETISIYRTNNETGYPRLAQLRIFRSFYCLNQDHLCIFINSDDDFRKWELARRTQKYITESKIYVFFEKCSLSPEKEEMNEIFVKLVHKSVNQCQSTVFEQLFEDELNVVANSKIIFQGFEIELKELCTSWFEYLDEDAVCNILELQKLVIGTELPTEPKFYIKRKLKIKVLGAEIRNLIASSVQSGRKKVVEKFLLFSLKERNTDNFFERNSGIINNSCKFIENIEEARNELSELIKKKDVSFFFCTYDSGKYELRYTFRNERKFLEDENVDEGFLITQCGCEKITFLSDIAGMGKSTTMLKLAVEYKKINKTHWVSYIQLGQYSTDIEIAKILMKPSTAMNFLASNILKLTGVDFKLFIDACSATGNVAIFLDGYDELSQKAKEVFPTYLLALEDTKIGQIFVSGRHNVMRDLEMLISRNSIEFIEFTVEDKEICLLEIWKQKLAETGDHVKSENLKTIAKKIINDTESERNSIKDILAIPLQIKMFAVAYYDKMLEYCKSNADFNIQFDMLHLYKNFVDSQVSHYHAKNISEWGVMHKEKRKKYIRDKLIGVHEFVCSLIVPNLVRIKIEDTEEKIENLRDDLGLITDDSQTPPLFLHKTIAEYLAAEYIVQNFLLQSNDEQSEQVFESVLIEGTYDILRTFINSLLDVKNLAPFFNPKLKEKTDELVRKITPFHVAAAEGNVTLMKALLQRCKSFINSIDTEGFTPLHMACEKGRIDSVKFLLTQGLSVIDRANDGNTAFQLAAAGNHVDIMELLIQQDISLLNQKNNNGKTALHSACQRDSIEAVKFLLNLDCPLNDVDGSGDTMLHYATEGGHVPIMELLIQRDKSLLNQKNSNGVAPLHLACSWGGIEAVNFLLNLDCPLNDVDGSGDTMLHYATKGGHVPIMELLIQRDKSLLNQKNSNGVAPLHRACSLGRIEAVDFLLNLDCPLNDVDGSGDTMLHYAAMEGHVPIMELLIQRDKSLLNQKNSNGVAPLHRACSWGGIEAANFLVNLDCPLNDVDGSGDTMLHYAAMGGHVPIMELLIQRDKSLLNQKNNDGVTAIHRACQGASIEAANFLLNLDCPLNDVDGSGDTMLHYAAMRGHVPIMELLIQRDKSLLNQKNSNGVAPLHRACSWGRIEAVDFLLNLDCPLNDVDGSGDTMFHYAAMGGHVPTMELLIQRDKSLLSQKNIYCEKSLHRACIAAYGHTEILEISFQRHAPLLNMQNNHGVTPLQTAIRNGHIAVAKYMLNHGCSGNNRDNDGDTVFNVAALQNNVEAMELLLQYDKSLINGQNNKGNTPLHQACCRRNAEAATLLLTNQDSFKNIYNRDGNTAFHESAKNGCIRMLELFLQYDKSILNIQTRDSKSPLQIACMDDKIDAFSFLKNIDFYINFRDNIYNHHIFYVAWKEQIETKNLVMKLDKFCVQHSKYKTVLYLTCSEGVTDCPGFSKYLYQPIELLLVVHYCKINAHKFDKMGRKFIEYLRR